MSPAIYLCGIHISKNGLLVTGVHHFLLSSSLPDRFWSHRLPRWWSLLTMTCTDQPQAETHSEKTRTPSFGEKYGTANIKVVENVAFADALARAQVRPWTKRMFQLYAICFIATLNSCINGYDGSLMSAINAMKPYQKQFGTKTTGAQTGFIFAIYTVGNLAGAFVSGPVTVSIPISHYAWRSVELC